MLTPEQIRQISIAIDAAIEVSKSEPRGLLRHLLNMTKMEVTARLKTEPERKRAAA